MRSWLLTLVALLACAASPAGAQSWMYAKHAGGAANDYGDRVAIDANDNSYVVGAYSGTARFDAITLTGPGRWNVYLAKYDAGGNAVWATTVASTSAATSDIFANAVALDRWGNIYVAGRFLSDITFAGASRQSRGSSDMYLAKLSPTGAPIWIRTPGGEGLGTFGQDAINAIGLDSAGNCYITGTYNQDCLFDSIAISGTLVYEAFVAKYDSAGHALWARSGDGYGSFHIPLGIAVDGAGNCYVTGSFFNRLILGQFTLDADDAEQKAFIARLTSDGAFVWAQEIGHGGYYGAGQDVVFDRFGGLVIAGQYRASIRFGDIAHAYDNGLKYAVLVVSYDTSGAYRWSSTSAGSDQSAFTSRVRVDNGGNSFITGTFGGDIGFGSIDLSGATGNLHQDVFLAKLDPDGAWTRATAISSDAGIEGNSVALLSDGTCEVVGTFSDSLRYDARSLVSNGGLDMFLARIGLDAATVGPDQVTSHREVLLYPNPAGDLLHLDGVAAGERVRIFAMTGEEALEGSGPAIDLRALAPGAYLTRGSGWARLLIKSVE